MGNTPTQADKKVGSGKSLVSNATLALVPGADIATYTRRVQSIPTLSQEQELELARAYYEEHDLEAARQLVLANLRHVAYLAHRYAGYGLPQADLIQEGNIGLMKAVKRFNPSKFKVRFISFAIHWIRAEMQEYVLRNWRLVKIATTKAQRRLFFKLRGERKHLGGLSDEDARDMAEKLAVPLRELRQMELRMAAPEVSYDGTTEAADADDTGGGTRRLAPAEYLAAPDADPAEEFEALHWRQSQAEQLHGALECLDERSRDIIRGRWPAADVKRATLQQLADRHGISAERVRQLEKRALRQLRGQLQPKSEQRLIA